MDEVFAFTAASEQARKHLHRTIASPVPIAEIGEYDSPTAARLIELGFTEIRCWGSKPGAGNLRGWEHMQAGHQGLLYGGR